MTTAARTPETVTAQSLTKRRAELAGVLGALERKIQLGQQQLAADVEQHRLAHGALLEIERLLRLLAPDGQASTAPTAAAEAGGGGQGGRPQRRFSPAR